MVYGPGLCNYKTTIRPHGPQLSTCTNKGKLHRSLFSRYMIHSARGPAHSRGEMENDRADVVNNLCEDEDTSSDEVRLFFIAGKMFRTCAITRVCSACM